MKTSLVCTKKCEEMSIGELMDISYEMLASSSVLTIYDGKYMLSNGILLNSFKETNRMLTMIYENTMKMLCSIPISIE